jgi:hypothetical protein
MEEESVPTIWDQALHVPSQVGWNKDPSAAIFFKITFTEHPLYAKPVGYKVNSDCQGLQSVFNPKG